MNTKQTWRFIIAAILLLSATCDPKVKFEDPQPSGRKNLDAIPAGYHGKYLELSDSATLTIGSNLIVKEDLKTVRMTKMQLYEEIDTVFELDTLVYITDNMTVEFQFYGDSVNVITYDADTLFNLSENNLLREYKGFLFLNTPLEDDLWKVKIIKAKEDSLMLANLVSTSEIDTISPLTHIITIKDTTENKIDEYRLNPTKSELKKILARKKMDFGYLKN